MRRSHIQQSKIDHDDYEALDDGSKAARAAEKINTYWALRGVQANATPYRRGVVIPTRYGARRFEVWEIKSDLKGHENNNKRFYDVCMD